MTLSRRSFLGGLPAAAFVPSVWQPPAPGEPAGATVHPAFPTHDPAMVKEMVGVAHGNVATAGGCLASQYMAAWLIARRAGEQEAEAALHYVAPVGEKELYVAQAMAAVRPFLARDTTGPAPAKQVLPA